MSVRRRASSVPNVVNSGMRISIVFPYNTWGGAFRSTYELANRMAAAGESVHVYIPFFPYLEGEQVTSRAGMALLIRGLARSLVRWNRLPWFDLQVPLRVVPLISDRYLPDADVVMANHWPTTASVAALSPRKGRKFLFVRDTDPWSPRYDREIASFRLPLIKIALAPWIRDFLTTEVGTEVAGVVSNGTNLEDFAGAERQENGVPTVAMIYGSSHKCVHDSAPAGRPRRGKRVRMRSCQLTSGEVVCRSVDGRLRGPRF